MPTSLLSDECPLAPFELTPRLTPLFLAVTAASACAHPQRHTHPQLIVWLAFCCCFLLAAFLLTRALEKSLRGEELPLAGLCVISGGFSLWFSLWLLRLARRRPKRRPGA